MTAVIVIGLLALIVLALFVINGNLLTLGAQLERRIRQEADFELTRREERLQAAQDFAKVAEEAKAHDELERRRKR